VSRAAGIPEEKLANLNRWRESEAFSPIERLVLDYAESLTETPATHRPDLHDALRQHFTEKQLVELTTAIAWENFRARFNRAYDVKAQGFSDGAYCVLPERHPPPPART
jgi:alkylhydroperoxidase family enzyme